MSIAIVQNGSQIAIEARESSLAIAHNVSKLTTLSDLLGVLANDPPKSWPMLRSTASKIAEFCKVGIEETTIDRVYEMRGQFRRYLEKAPYSENSVRSYVNYARILIQKARQSGWHPYQTLPQEWQQVLALAPKYKCTEIARSLAVVKKAPREVIPDDVDAWGESAVQRGVRDMLVNRKKGRFWQLLRECGASDYFPLSAIRAQVYKVPFEKLPQPLRSETSGLLKWKTADFSVDRPKGGQIRQETADKICEKICQLYGFGTNIRSLSGLDSLAKLVQKNLVADYLSWCINERDVKGETLKNHLGRLDVAMRQHPSFAKLDLSWFKPLLESLPIEPESERRMRKAKKYLDYSVMESIPAKIHAQRLSASTSRNARRAELAMEEFLLKWMLALPWRQRNVRESRIGGMRPNIFKAKIPNYVPMDLPEWVRVEEQRNPEATFWQMHFKPEETKTGREIHSIVPRQLITPLEEYLTEFRPQLLRNGDPGTLFLTKEGTSMTRDYVYNLITRITWRHGGRSVNPHLFRDIVAFAWLKEHPKDYLTLSKILWHTNINYTIKVYGSRFDESSGVCAMETWLDEREARSK